MAFNQASGRSYTVWLPKAASTAIAVGDLMYSNGTGEITPATATSDFHVGVSQVDVTASTTGTFLYSNTTLIPVLVPVDDTEFFVPCTGATEAIIGTFVDLTDAGTADVAASAVDALFVTAVISSTLIKVRVNDMASYRSPA